VDKVDKDVKGLAFAKTVPQTSNPVTNFPEEPRFQLLPPFFAAARSNLPLEAVLPITTVFDNFCHVIRAPSGRLTMYCA